MKRVLQYIVYLAALVFMKFMEILPRGTFRFLGWLFSWLAVPLPPVGGLIRKNLRCAFPERVKRRFSIYPAAASRISFRLSASSSGSTTVRRR